jgi:tRNA threonylcarbamoyladenosine modification (KEOPS) complex  Pcc1 subunit
MIHARIVFLSEKEEKIEQVARAIEPDNLPNMSLKIDSDRVCLQFSTEKAGTLLTTVDDLLMNIKIAEETLSCTEER